MIKTKKNNLGFTLIELLVVSTIIVLLTAIGATTYVSLGQQSRDSRRKGDLEQIRAALEMYRTGNAYSSYPTALTMTCTTPGSIAEGGNTYLSTIPTDPKCTTYTYAYQALPATPCNGTTTPCSDYTVGTRLETSGSTCGVTISCGSVGNCNYCLGAYGKK